MKSIGRIIRGAQIVALRTPKVSVSPALSISRPAITAQPFVQSLSTISTTNAVLGVLSTSVTSSGDGSDLEESSEEELESIKVVSSENT